MEGPSDAGDNTKTGYAPLEVPFWADAIHAFTIVRVIGKRKPPVHSGARVIEFEQRSSSSQAYPCDDGKEKWAGKLLNLGQQFGPSLAA